MKELTFLGKGKLEWHDAEVPLICQPTDALVRPIGAQTVDAHFRTLLKSKKFKGRYPLTVEASGRRSGLQLAMQSLDTCGTCRIVGFHWGRGTPLPLWDMYARNLSIETGLVNARALLPELLTLAKGGRLRPELVTSTLAEWSDAPEALLENCTKVIVSRSPLFARYQDASDDGLAVYANTAPVPG